MENEADNGSWGGKAIEDEVEQKEAERRGVLEPWLTYPIWVGYRYVPGYPKAHLFAPSTCTTHFVQ